MEFIALAATSRLGLGWAAPSFRRSVLDIAPVSLGGVVDLGRADDDILGEMLEDRA